MSEIEMSQMIEIFKHYCLSINARIKMNNFIEEISSCNGESDGIKSVYKLLDDIVINDVNNKFRLKLEPGTKYFRARIIDPSDYDKPEKGIGIRKDDKLCGYNEDNSREPILGLSTVGRNNVAGASYLYLASNPETACIEIKPQLGDLISVATFELNSPLYIIDFSSEQFLGDELSALYNMSLDVFFTELMFRYSMPVTDSADYRASQVISDYLRKTGVDGIKYRRFLSLGGCNYTIFNCHRSKIKFCESKVVIYKQANHSFWDLNEKNEIMTNRAGISLIYDDKTAIKHLEDLKKHFKSVE